MHISTLTHSTLALLSQQHHYKTRRAEQLSDSLANLLYDHILDTRLLPYEQTCMAQTIRAKSDSSTTLISRTVGSYHTTTTTVATQCHLPGTT